jgi:hypothetical protein
MKTRLRSVSLIDALVAVTVSWMLRIDEIAAAGLAMTALSRS